MSQNSGEQKKDGEPFLRFFGGKSPPPIRIVDPKDPPEPDTPTIIDRPKE